MMASSEQIVEGDLAAAIDEIARLRSALHDIVSRTDEGNPAHEWAGYALYGRDHRHTHGPNGESVGETTNGRTIFMCSCFRLIAPKIGGDGWARVRMNAEFRAQFEHDGEYEAAYIRSICDCGSEDEGRHYMECAAWDYDGSLKRPDSVA